MLRKIDHKQALLFLLFSVSKIIPIVALPKYCHLDDRRDLGFYDSTKI